MIFASKVVTGSHVDQAFPLESSSLGQLVGAYFKSTTWRPAVARAFKDGKVKAACEEVLANYVAVPTSEIVKGTPTLV